jgi:hypothetical protein
VAVQLLSTPMESRQGRVQERFVSCTIYGLQYMLSRQRHARCGRKRTGRQPPRGVRPLLSAIGPAWFSISWQGLDHDCGTLECRPLSSWVCYGVWAVRRHYALRYSASAMRVASRAASVWADTSMRRSLAPASAYAARPSRTCCQLPMRCRSAGSARPSLASTRA